MNKQNIRGRSPFAGFAVTLGRIGTRRRMLERLRPEGGLIALDLELIDVIAELDPGMIDWRAHLVR